MINSGKNAKVDRKMQRCLVNVFFSWIAMYPAKSQRAKSNSNSYMDYKPPF